MHNFDPTNNISWQLGHRGRVAVFIDGNNLFHAARFHNIDIDLGAMADKGRREITHGTVYDERNWHEPLPAQYLQDQMEMQKSQANGFQAAMHVMIETEMEEEAAEFEAASEFIRITDEH